MATVVAVKLWLWGIYMVLQTNCIRQPNNLAWFILQPQYTDNLQNICERIFTNAFKVAIRNFHGFIQAGNFLTDVKGHYQHADN